MSRSVAGARVPEVDMVRGLNVAVMVVVHTLAFFATAAAQTGPWRPVMDLGKGAGGFVLCMGISSVFSQRRRVGPGLRRAGELVAQGYALNALKFAVPIFLLGGLPAGLYEDIGMAEGDPTTLAFFLLLGDILQLSGLALAAVTLLRAARLKGWHAALLAAVIAAVSPWLWGLRGGGVVGEYLCDLFFSDRYTVFFPFFPWAAYALAGWALGEELKEAEGVARTPLFRRWAAIGAGLAVVGALLGTRWPVLWKGPDFYRTGPAGFLFVTGVVMVSFQIAHVAWPRLPAAAQGLIGFLSRRVTRVYFVSWVLICWNAQAVGFMAHERWPVLLALVVTVLVASLAGTYAFERLEATWRRREPEEGAVKAA